MTLWLTGIGATALTVATSVVIALRRVFVVVRVSGRSMVPTLQPGDRVIVRRVGRRGIQRGQVIVFERLLAGQWQTGRLPRPATCRWMIKRVTAIPGDPVPPDVGRRLNAVIGTCVPDGQLVVIGDGQLSMDSRMFGYLPADRVLGVVVRVMSPSGASKTGFLAASG